MPILSADPNHRLAAGSTNAGSANAGSADDPQPAGYPAPIYQAYLHDIVYLHGLSWITVAFGIMIAYILAPTTLLVRAPYLQYSVDLAFVIMGIGLIFLLAGYLRRRTSIFTVGDGQISIKVGVFSTRDIVILARQVGDVSVSRSLLGRMLGYGTVVVTGVGGSVEVFAEIEDPYQFQEAIRAIAG